MSTMLNIIIIIVDNNFLITITILEYHEKWELYSIRCVGFLSTFFYWDIFRKLFFIWDTTKIVKQLG